MDIMSKMREAVTRADEAGGEFRDRLIERYQSSERAQKMMARLQQFRGKKHEIEPRSPSDAAIIEEATASEAAPVAERSGLGDSAVAAQIFGRESCPWSGRAITLLENRKIDYDFVDLDDDDNAALESPLVAETNQNTVPYVYLRGQFIGGFNALAEVDRLGQLELAAMDGAERATNPAAQKVVIAPRPNSDETDESAAADSSDS